MTARRCFAGLLGAVAAIGLITAQAAAQEPMEGTWEARLDTDSIAWIQFRMDQDGTSQSGGSLTRAERDALLAQAASAPAGAVTLTLQRDAGSLTLEGRVRGDRAAGVFTLR